MPSLPVNSILLSPMLFYSFNIHTMCLKVSIHSPLILIGLVIKALRILKPQTYSMLVKMDLLLFQNTSNLISTILNDPNTFPWL